MMGIDDTRLVVSILNVPERNYSSTRGREATSYEDYLEEAVMISGQGPSRSSVM